jgi:hypothetical protein
VDYRPKTNAVILLDMGHTLRGKCAWEEQGKGREGKGCAQCRGVNIVILNREATIGRGLGSSEEVW